MKDDRPTTHQVRTGRATTARLKRQPVPAEALPACPGFGHMCAATLDAPVVLARGDSWVAEVLFENVPPGDPETVGTRDASPRRSYKEAHAAGIAIIDGSRYPPPPPSHGADRSIAVAYGP